MWLSRLKEARWQRREAAAWSARNLARQGGFAEGHQAGDAEAMRVLLTDTADDGSDWRDAGSARPAKPDQQLGVVSELEAKADRADSRTSLTVLAQQFETDKWGAHRYTPHYEHQFARFADQPVNLLEIGIGGYEHSGKGGGSLLMWKSYFPKGNIFGLDIHDKSFMDQERIKTFTGDQSDEAILRKIAAEAGSLHIVIDDGSHRSTDVIKTFSVLFPLLALDGIYVIEDTQTSYWPSWGGARNTQTPWTTMAFVKRLIDGLNYEEFLGDSYTPSYTDLNVAQVTCYHNLVFIQKGENREGVSPAKPLPRRLERIRTALESGSRWWRHKRQGPA